MKFGSVWGKLILYMLGFIFPVLRHAEWAGHARWLAAYSPQNGHGSLGRFLTNGNEGYIVLQSHLLELSKMLLDQNVFQGFAVAYFRLQTLIRVGLFFVAAYYTFQFRHLVYACGQQGLIAVCEVTKIDFLLSLCSFKLQHVITAWLSGAWRCSGVVVFRSHGQVSLWEC